MTKFKKSVKWYDENLAALLPQYRGKYVVDVMLPKRMKIQGVRVSLGAMEVADSLQRLGQCAVMSLTPPLEV